MRVKTTTRLGLTVTKEDKINHYKAMEKQKAKPKQDHEKPIIFNTEMVAAILDGRKTQTRRVMKPQPGEGWTPADYGTVHKKVNGVPDIDTPIAGTRGNLTTGFGLSNFQ